MDRLAATAAIARQLRDELVVTGLGNSTFDLFHERDRARNFYTWGSMGTAFSVGLGLAIARPSDRVIVLDGDGSLLMGLSSLVSIGRLQPTNLVCLLWDNQHLGLTGGQTSATATTADLAGVARALGFRRSERFDDLESLSRGFASALRESGPTMLVARIGQEASGAKPPRRPAAITYRFMRALGSLAPDERMVWDDPSL